MRQKLKLFLNGASIVLEERWKTNQLKYTDLVSLLTGLIVFIMFIHFVFPVNSFMVGFVFLILGIILGLAGFYLGRFLGMSIWLLKEECSQFYDKSIQAGIRQEYQKNPTLKTPNKNVKPRIKKKR